MYYAKWNKSEKDKYDNFTHMWNLRNKTDEHRGQEKSIEGNKPNHERLLMIENKLRVGEGRWMRDILRRALVGMTTGCCT